MTTALVVGAVSPVVVGLFATGTGMDRDRAFYPVVLIVIAFLYSLFAVIGQSTQALMFELAIGSVFIIMATVGFKRSLWVAAAGLVLHGVMDYFHPSLVDNPGVPAWWPAFCGTYDVVAGVYLGVLLKQGRIRTHA